MTYKKVVTGQVLGEELWDLVWEGSLLSQEVFREG